ncbi:MAG: hypothetical protein ACRDSH_18315 [Pseudonocardiaceae bacterium]
MSNIPGITAVTGELRHAFDTGATLDLAGATVPATMLAALLAGTAPDAGASNEGRIPGLRLIGATVRGELKLPGATITALVELTDCTFDEPIDLYAAELAGLRLSRCTLPGVQAANVRVRSELALECCTVTGPVVLPDARIEGPLRLIGTRLNTAGGHALIGVRLAVRGVFDARDLQVHGEVRLSGARVEGNIDFRGARLIRPGGDALEASGVQVGGNLRCDRNFSTQGRVMLAGASVAGNAVFSGATLHGTTDLDERAVLVLPRGAPDPSAALVADRLAVHGNLVLDGGFSATSTVRLSTARVGGYLRLSGATLGSPVEPGTVNGDQSRPLPVALAADGIEVLGDLEARRFLPYGETSGDAGALRAHGQIRLRAAMPAGWLDQGVTGRAGGDDRKGRLRQPRVHRSRRRPAQPGRRVEIGESQRRPARWARQGCLGAARSGDALPGTQARFRRTATRRGQSGRCGGRLGFRRPDALVHQRRGGHRGLSLRVTHGHTGGGRGHPVALVADRAARVRPRSVRPARCELPRQRPRRPRRHGAAGQAAAPACRTRAGWTAVGTAPGLDRRLRLSALACGAVARGVLAARITVVRQPPAGPARQRPEPILATGDLHGRPAGPSGQLRPGRVVASLRSLRLGGQRPDRDRLAAALDWRDRGHPDPHAPVKNFMTSSLTSAGRSR